MRSRTFYGLCALLLVVAIFIACAVGSSWFTNGDFKTWFNSWGAGTEDELPEEDEGEQQTAANYEVLFEVG